MSAETGMSRRAMLVKIGLLLNGIVGVVLAVPIVRYLVSPVTRERQIGYESWLSLGGLEQFPAGQTRLATYRNPAVNAWDGETADIACWVRNVDDQNFQVFAINCAHLGCPVRWFAQSKLFMCHFKGRRLHIEYQEERSTARVAKAVWRDVHNSDRPSTCSCGKRVSPRFPRHRLPLPVQGSGT
jgi:hypothetical protein